jgi:hypothetical protein
MGQLAVAAGLIQQRQQVGLARQQVGLQKKSLAAQNQANSLAAAQLSEMQKNEENRKKEKLLDVWSAEFQHRGMSPLESHTQALAEMEIMDLIVGFSDLSESLERKKVAALALVKRKSARHIPVKLKKVFLYSLAATLIVALISGLTNNSSVSGISKVLLLISVAISYVTSFSFFGCVFFFLKNLRKKKPLTSEDEALALEPVYEWFTKKVGEIKGSLDSLPASKLSDDSSFREMLQDLSSNQ